MDPERFIGVGLTDPDLGPRIRETKHWAAIVDLYGTLGPQCEYLDKLVNTIFKMDHPGLYFAAETKV